MLRTLHRKLLRRFDLPGMLSAASASVGGRTFLKPKVQGVMCEIAEPWVVDLLARLLPAKAGAFLDVGVNLGQTLLAVKAADPTRELFRRRA